MSKYCPKCKHNFSDVFYECVYCGSELKDGIIEIEDVWNEKPIHEMTDEEILDKYSDYKKRIEEQTRHKMTDSEFLLGIREARRDSLNHQADKFVKSVQESNVPKCPTCQSADIKKISGLSKASSVAMWGIFARKAYKQWHCNNCGSEW